MSKKTQIKSENLLERKTERERLKDKPPLAKAEVETLIPGWYTAEEAARELGISIHTIRYYRKMHRLGGPAAAQGLEWKMLPGNVMLLPAEAVLAQKWRRQHGVIRRGRQRIVTAVDA